MKFSHLIALVAAGSLAIAGCGGGDGGSSKDETTLSLVSYSTPREAYEQLIPEFQKTPAGKGVKFQESYGASGEQSRAVEGGLAADVVAFSLAPDVKRLIDAKQVGDDWDGGETKGMVTRSVVVFAVRKGNPKGIDQWEDLVEDGVEVVTPNPFTSGGARWNLMAGYGAMIEQGKSPEEGLEFLQQVLENTPVQSKSAREALQVFAAGKGDVMLAYENEAITAQQKGEDIDYVIPDETILIENPAAVTSTSKHAKEAQAFLDFLLTPEAQRIYAEAGYRPVNEEVAGEFTDTFPEPKVLFTIDDLGGWDTVMTDFFDREEGSVAKIEEGLGVATDG